MPSFSAMGHLLFDYFEDFEFIGSGGVNIFFFLPIFLFSLLIEEITADNSVMGSFPITMNYTENHMEPFLVSQRMRTNVK